MAVNFPLSRITVLLCFIRFHVLSILRWPFLFFIYIYHFICIPFHPDFLCHALLCGAAAVHLSGDLTFVLSAAFFSIRCSEWQLLVWCQWLRLRRYLSLRLISFPAHFLCGVNGWQAHAHSGWGSHSRENERGAMATMVVNKYNIIVYTEISPLHLLQKSNCLNI